MLGAIIGDFVGSPYERRDNRTKNYDFPLTTTNSRLTDDSVLTFAVADALLNGKDYTDCLHRWGNQYKNAGYGKQFKLWLADKNPQPYGSYGNGSAMRVSPIGWLFTTLDETIKEAEKSAACTHNHPEGVKGAVAVAIAIFHASNGKDKTFIANEITQKVGYNLNFTLEQIKPKYRFDSSCQGSVPQAIKCFLESTNYEDAIRKAVSLGGDSDTLAAMAGSIAEAHYGGVPDNLKDLVMAYMANNMKQVLKKFEEQKEIVRQQREEYKLKH